MQRVLHVLSSLERSGMEMMLLSSYNEWLNQGFQCDVIATAKTPGVMVGDIKEAGYEVYHIPFRGSSRYMPNLRLFNDFFELCSSGYDVVHIHTEAAAPLFAILAKLAGVPKIALTKHNVFNYTGVLRFRKYLERLLIRSLGGRYGMISESVSRCEWERFKNFGSRVWNWLDDSYYRPASMEERVQARKGLDLGEDEFAILSVGNCSPVKNHAAILGAVALLPRQINAVYIHLGREQADEPEKALSKELGIASQVRFMGSRPDPRPFYWAADVYVMPSLHEGLSIAALEAVASGVPAIFSKVDGLTEITSQATHIRECSTAAQSVATAIAEVSRVGPDARRAGALVDSGLIRARFSVEAGVRSNVENLYCAS